MDNISHSNSVGYTYIALAGSQKSPDLIANLPVVCLAGPEILSAAPASGCSKYCGGLAGEIEIYLPTQLKISK